MRVREPVIKWGWFQSQENKLDILSCYKRSHFMIGSRTLIFYRCTGPRAIIKWNAYFMVASQAPIFYRCTRTAAIIKWNAYFMVSSRAPIFYRCTRTAAIIKWKACFVLVSFTRVPGPWGIMGWRLGRLPLLGGRVLRGALPWGIIECNCSFLVSRIN